MSVAEPESDPAGAAESGPGRRRIVLAAAAILLAVLGGGLTWFAIKRQSHLPPLVETTNPDLAAFEPERAQVALVPVQVETEGRNIVGPAKAAPPHIEMLPPKEPDPPKHGLMATPPQIGAAITSIDTVAKNDGRRAPVAPPPQPESRRLALASALYQIDGIDAVDLKIAAIPSVDRDAKNFGPMVWSPDGLWFYLLDENNVVYKVDGKSLEQVARLDTGAACSAMSLSREGLVVGLPGLQELWVVDADTLAVKRQIPVDTVRMVAASPSSSVGYAASAEGLYVVDLRGGRPLHFVDKLRLPGASSTVQVTWSGAFISMRASEDGQYLYTSNSKGLKRLRIAGEHLIWEQATGDIYQGYQYDLCLSKDGKWVTVPTDSGNRLVGSAVAIFDSRDLQRPALAVQRRGYLLTAVAFDPKTGNLYGAEKDRLDVFGPRGGWLKRLNWPHRTPHHLSVHPAGERIAVWSREKLVILDFQPGRLASDLAGSTRAHRPATNARENPPSVWTKDKQALLQAGADLIRAHLAETENSSKVLLEGSKEWNVPESEVPVKFSEKHMTTFPSAFEVTPEEARQWGTADYRNRSESELKADIEFLKQHQVEFPSFSKWLIHRFEAGKIPKDIELEFARRVVKALRNQVEAAMK